MTIEEQARLQFKESLNIFIIYYNICSSRNKSIEENKK